MKLAFYVQHFRGAGHLVRTMALANTAAERGHQVLVLSGGHTPKVLQRDPRVSLVELAPLSSTADFSQLLDRHGKPASSAYLVQRLDTLKAKLSHYRAQALVVESWPLARNLLNDELEPLVAWLKQTLPHTSLICSVRDVLEPKRDKRAKAMIARFHRYFDGLMVHGQADILSISEAFPALQALETQAYYSGYIDNPALEEPAQAAKAEKAVDIVVAAGSGGLDQGQLLGQAWACARISPQWQWRFLIGDGVPKSIKAQLDNPPAHITVEANRADYRQLLAHSRLSLSRFGYNTAIDVTRCAQRALVIPVTAFEQQEQQIRAKRFAQHGLVQCCLEPITTEALLERIKQQLAGEPHRAPFTLNARGAENSIQWLEEKLR